MIVSYHSEHADKKIRLTRLNGGQHGRDTGELRIEVAGISSAANLRQERRLDPLVVDVIPVNLLEEGLIHDLLGIRWTATKAGFRLAGEELLQDGDGVARHVDGVKGLVSQNSVVDFFFVFAAEWRLLEQHLVDQYTECPPVDSTTVLLVEQNLIALAPL